MERGQVERLLPMLEEALHEAGCGWSDLGALAVCTGPGNFTGLRIGVAAARGLALALDRPAIGVTRLEALAEGRAGPVIVAIDARRDALYLQRFDGGAPLGPPALITAADLPAPDGALRLGAAAAVGSPEAAETPDAETLARIAARRLGAGAPPPAPLYLRPPDAAPAPDLPPVLLDDA